MLLRTPAGIYRPICDVRGNVLALLDESGDIAESCRYDGFGTPRLFDSSGSELPAPCSALGNPFGFACKRYDATTALYHFGVRWYDPALGRFISPDPLGFVDGPNRYAYCAGDPANFVDPWGLCTGRERAPETGWDAYWSDVDSFYMGYQDAVVGSVEGLWHAVRHPVRTAAGVWHAAYYPEQTYRHARDALTATWTSGPEGQGRIVGEVFITGATVGAGYMRGVEAAGTAGRGIEFSHWIPGRWGGPRSVWNGNYVPAATHALSDPWRYRFMPRPWKAMNPMPNPILQQTARLPRALVGVGTGTGVAGGSLAGQAASSIQGRDGASED